MGVGGGKRFLRKERKKKRERVCVAFVLSWRERERRVGKKTFFSPPWIITKSKSVLTRGGGHRTLGLHHRLTKVGMSSLFWIYI